MILITWSIFEVTSWFGDRWPSLGQAVLPNWSVIRQHFRQFNRKLLTSRWFMCWCCLWLSTFLVDPISILTGLVVHLAADGHNFLLTPEQVLLTPGHYSGWFNMVLGDLKSWVLLPPLTQSGCPFSVLCKLRYPQRLKFSIPLEDVENRHSGSLELGAVLHRVWSSLWKSDHRSRINVTKRHVINVLGHPFHLRAKISRWKLQNKKGIKN